ncbi:MULTISPECIES: ribosomal protection-like ABC-F family protein [unclassified Streptomyces]|uniref:ribosomal protection-like ABC-F family protein n=1 Tax=unclassified Streptomyces TaxID=2593676 RepID=UPI0001C1A309|nr:MULTISPECIES: ABC-F family ATP-binding cassette domain-containing protein [unclassified Streptomyces]AEN08282.1 ABC transporter related protein [Streptomyces sp. SirexAA-E]MYR68490.1 ATP-binding cassette domain-containing protein [Streptomyces sp. SID4939]MYS03169.1 ATP-binding cassette domain-containing protein [Streptomyces sp. SID4940]MYT66573.1 ATP-binding cassette domain-containing protein [Streptomyces sp. SID8357]MYT83494.1 ATP-binding cassette domain-containing protein [Streptomyces
MSSPHDSAQLSMNDVSKTYGTRTVLDQVSLTVRPGEKAGVIGENGSGKSTLLRLMAGAEAPDGGDVTVRFPGGTGYLAQTLALDLRHTVQDAVDVALGELRAMERLLRAAEEEMSGADPTDARLTAYGDLLTAYEERGGYQADARTDAAMYGLGLGHLTRDRVLGTLSGGEQSRLALACVLASAPDLLLLDEPTNHLDATAVGWLEDHLRAHRGTLVAVTHDRAFLERITTVILEVDRDLRGVTRYGDGWGGYRTAKAAARRRRAQEHQEYLTELARTEELVDAAGRRLAGSGKDPGQGFGKHRRSHEAKLSGQVRAARTRLEALRRAPVPAPPEPLRFAADLALAREGGPDRALGPSAEFDSVVVGDRLEVPALRIEPGQRLLVTGPNGAGKSTLLRVLAGDLAPDSGTVRRRARIGYLPQELPVRPTRRSLLATFAAGRPGFADEYADQLLGLGLFRPEDLDVPVAALSIGQQRRLALARLVTRPADLLVLDEPTNHIALVLVEELEEALARFRGAVVVVSHDRSFRARFPGDRLELRAGRPVPGTEAYALPGARPSRT